MLAAVGQVQLMHIWAEIFSEFNVPVGQLLLTRGDFSNRTRYLNARNTIQSLLEHSVVPIINENDTVATQEIGPPCKAKQPNRVSTYSTGFGVR